MSAVTVGMAISQVSRPGCASSSRRGINLVAGGVAHGDCGSVAFLADDENPRATRSRQSRSTMPSRTQ